jgi:hypothetical protein
MTLGTEGSDFLSSAGLGEAGGAVEVNVGFVEVARSIAADLDDFASLHPPAASKTSMMGMVTLGLMFMEPPAP